MTIIHYQGDVFTHEGQTSVHEFGIEILAARAALAKPISLTVYVGYHGNKNGAWFKNFDATEDAETASIGNVFPNAKLVQVRGPGMSATAIQDAVKAGKVFFTWCDSDTRVNAVMEGDMPRLAPTPP